MPLLQAQGTVPSWRACSRVSAWSRSPVAASVLGETLPPTPCTAVPTAHPSGPPDVTASRHNHLGQCPCPLLRPLCKFLAWLSFIHCQKSPFLPLWWGSWKKRMKMYTSSPFSIKSLFSSLLATGFCTLNIFNHVVLSFHMEKIAPHDQTIGKKFTEPVPVNLSAACMRSFTGRHLIVCPSTPKT